MSILKELRHVLTASLVFLMVVSGAAARDYIEVWPEGWSDVVPLFSTSIFGDRFFAAPQRGAINFLSVDGLYFRELDLTYRVVYEGEIKEETILRARAEITGHCLGFDAQGNGYVIWSEKLPSSSVLNLVTFQAAPTEPQPIVLLETDHQLQDLSAFQADATTHLVWSEWEEHLQIKYGRIENGELVAVEPVTKNSSLSVRPSVTLDLRGDPCVAWMETDPHGAVGIFFSKRTDAGWSAPLRVGTGTVKDIEQSGSIALDSNSSGIMLAWAAPLRTGNRLFIHLTQVDAQLQAEEPIVLALGSRPRFVGGAQNPQLIWQGQDQFGSKINHGYYMDGGLAEITNLTVGRKAAFRPEVICLDGFIYAYWLQADAERGFTVHQINNQFPKAISFWRKAGIDEKAPLYHILYLVISTLMLSFVYLFGNFGVLLAGGIISTLFQKIEAYRQQGLFYQITVNSMLLLVIRYLPIPAVGPQFFGLIHYGLSVVLAILGTYLILRGVRQRGFFVTAGSILIWMFLFLFFSLIPQNILS